MKVEEKLAKLGLELPNLEDLYRTNASGAHYISHFPVQNLLYLSGTTPRKDGQGYLPGVVGKDLTVAQGYGPRATPRSRRWRPSSMPSATSSACSRSSTW